MSVERARQDQTQRSLTILFSIKENLHQSAGRIRREFEYRPAVVFNDGDNPTGVSASKRLT